jgi:putative flavoprotein involved in K+ transport
LVRRQSRCSRAGGSTAGALLVGACDREAHDAIKANKLSVYPGIECFEEETVVFTDGKRRLFDVVVLATGYEAALGDFLECAREVTDERGYPKVHGAESSVPGLYFLGFRNPPTGQLRDINLEAKAITASIVAERAATSDPPA